MSTQTAPNIEFRCNSCWQPIQADIDMEGRSTSCTSCGANTIVPQAIANRVREADARPAAPLVNPYAQTANATREMCDAELMKLVQRENSLPGGQMCFQGFPNASLVSRFFANLVDGLFVLVMCGLGIMAIVAAAAVGLVETPQKGQAQFDPTILIIFSFFPIVATIIQWNLIATRGQSIGKLLLCIRMITMDGKLPGFLHGVVLRNWVRALLSTVVPFFGLVDVLFIFGDSSRCLHDYIAGTRVVQA